MKKIDELRYFDTRQELERYFNDNFEFIKNQKITHCQTGGGYHLEPDFCVSDDYLYIEFKNGYKLKCSTLFYSSGEFYIGNNIEQPEWEPWIIHSLIGRKLVDFEIIKFSEEYEINPSTEETRPAGGDYYREIIFKLDNGKTLTIVAQDSLSDGYMDIFIK